MTFPETYRNELLETIGKIDTTTVDQAIDWLAEARENDRHIFICGNGGSAATSSHFVVRHAEGRELNREKRFRIMALNDQMPTLTAYANDVITIACLSSSSRTSRSRAISSWRSAARAIRPTCCAPWSMPIRSDARPSRMTGRDGGKLGPMANLNIHVPAPHMGRIEDGTPYRLPHDLLLLHGARLVLRVRFK